MHDWVAVASDAFGVNFRSAEEAAALIAKTACRYSQSATGCVAG
jgi:hypothetical protein